jgi:hypothetical protein
MEKLKINIYIYSNPNNIDTFQNKIERRNESKTKYITINFDTYTEQ